MPESERPMCIACGSQYDAEASSPPKNCKICDDPRQFVPASGQHWTTQSELRGKHCNKWHLVEPRVWSIWTEPKFGIGQRCFFLETSAGNILWDMISLLDEPTIDFINCKGGIKAIVISHPHYYTTYVDWARVFNCPVYVSADDQEWLCQKPATPQTLRLIAGTAGAAEKVLPDVTAIKTGGHFPGSLVLHWEGKLFIADSIVTVPVSMKSIRAFAFSSYPTNNTRCLYLPAKSAHTPHPRPPGQTSYSFQWSIPNMIPLSPAEILKMWRAIEPYDFDMTFGAIAGMDVRDGHLKERMLESMKIQTRGEGWKQH